MRTSWLTSARRGRFSSVSVWSVSSEAIINGSAAFLAPEIGIEPVELGAAANYNAIHDRNAPLVPDVPLRRQLSPFSDGGAAATAAGTSGAR